MRVLRTIATTTRSRALGRSTMGKKKRPAIPDEQHLCLPPHPQATLHATPIVDTHTHLLSTYAKYRSVYPSAKHEDIFAFVRGLYCVADGEGTHGGAPKHKTAAIVDVWCEAPVTKEWKEMADSALDTTARRETWGGVEYWFVMGVHPHEARLYTDDVERDILAAMSHPRCVGWGEIGLDYHYDHSPRDVQRTVFMRQLQNAVRLGKPLTIHTREAEADTERILKAEVPRAHPIHVHCFTDSPEFAFRLIEHFPNLYIGITGVITYSTNLNTSNLIRALAAAPPPLRILLETDAPYMIPANVYRDTAAGSSKLPICHTGMVPWTAEFVSDVAKGVTAGEGDDTGVWDVERVMREARENAWRVYGV